MLTDRHMDGYDIAKPHRSQKNFIVIKYNFKKKVN